MRRFTYNREKMNAYEIWSAVQSSRDVEEHISRVDEFRNIVHFSKFSKPKISSLVFMQKTLNFQWILEYHGRSSVFPTIERKNEMKWQSRASLIKKFVQ
ncbi:hypothetical protein ACTXT7_004472 [Hymenolepis weldensis]